MTGDLIKKEKFGQGERYIGRIPHEDEGRGQGDASKSQGMSEQQTTRR